MLTHCFCIRRFGIWYWLLLAASGCTFNRWFASNPRPKQQLLTSDRLPALQAYRRPRLTACMLQKRSNPGWKPRKFRSGPQVTNHDFLNESIPSPRYYNSNSWIGQCEYSRNTKKQIKPNQGSKLILLEAASDKLIQSKLFPQPTT